MNKQTPETPTGKAVGQRSIVRPKSKSSGSLISLTINDIDLAGDRTKSSEDLLKAVLCVAESEYPNQNLALQIVCGPLDLFGKSIPPWFGSHKRRHDHLQQSLAMPDKDLSSSISDLQSESIDQNI